MITYSLIKDKNNTINVLKISQNIDIEVNTVKELKEEINKLKFSIEEQSRTVLDKKQEIDNFEPDLDDCTDRYDDMLDEVYRKVNIVGMEYKTSYALEELDPIAYRCGLNDFVDSLELSEFSRYVDLQDELEELENELEELENELEELENELEELEE